MKKTELIEKIFASYETAKEGKQIFDAPTGDAWIYPYVFERMVNAYNSISKTPVKNMYFIANIDNVEWDVNGYFMRHNKAWLETYIVVLDSAIERMNNRRG